MYSIQDVSNKTGLSTHTLRYYEKEGLISGVERSQGGFRQYTDEDLERLGLIRCLKNTGMSIQEIARFVQLTHEGDHTITRWRNGWNCCGSTGNGCWNAWQKCRSTWTR